VEISDIRANLSLVKVDVSAFVPKALKRPSILKCRKMERNAKAELSVLFCEKHYNAPCFCFIFQNGRYKWKYEA
jgi:hypothetical protein